MSVKHVPDRPLQLSTIPVIYLDGQMGMARAEGNNAAWLCGCEDALPLIGRCYYQFGWDCHTVCPTCGRRYRVQRDTSKKAINFKEF